MKTSHAFWGVFLLSLGGLFFLRNFGIIDPDWTGIWRFWPLALILWGVYALIPHKGVKWFLAAIIGLFIGAILFWFFSFGWIDRDFDHDWRGVKVQTLQEELRPETKRASLSVETGATRIRFDGTSDNLIEVTSRTPFGEYEMETTHTSDLAEVELSLKGDRIRFPSGEKRNYMNFKLHPSIPWELNFKVGAVSANLDLSSVNIEKATFETGATSIKLRLGTLANDVVVEIHTGASSITVEVPKESGCKIEANTALSSKRFRDFAETNDGTYVSENYESATKKILLRFDVGVSSLNVKRYQPD